IWNGSRKNLLNSVSIWRPASARLGVGIGDVDWRRPADPVRARRIAVQALRRLAVIVEIAHHRLDRAGGPQIDVFARGVRRPVDRVGGAGGGRPDRGVRMLIGRRPASWKRGCENAGWEPIE